MKTKTSFLILLMSLLLTQINQAQIPKTLSYHGFLSDASGNAMSDDNCRLTFGLYETPSDGTPLWLEVQTVSVDNGVFSTVLGHINPLNLEFDKPYWLGITVGEGPELAPRAQLTSSAYSLKAQSIADSAVTGGKIASGQVVRSINSMTDEVELEAGENVKITQSGNRLRIAADLGIQTATMAAGSDSFWTLKGNADIDPATNFLGTTDNNPLELRVNNQRALRLEFSIGSPNVIGGFVGNTVSVDVRGATIGGGGAVDAGSLRRTNAVISDYGTVSGGVGNTAEGLQSAVGGGSVNTARGSYSIVGGGTFNIARGNYGTVGGGYLNFANGDSSTVAGGKNNNAFGLNAAIGGGSGNEANGTASTIPGGKRNAAIGDYSFAAGRQAKANHLGAFVWADGIAADFASTGINQFLIRASGGVGVNRNNPEAALHIGGTPGVDGIRFPDGTLQTTAAISSGSFWKLAGNSGTVAGTNFLGTTDDQPLEFHVRGSRAIRIEPRSTPNMIGGFASNSVSTTASGATIGGGGGGRSGKANTVMEDFGTVSGGEGNEVNAEHGTVGGGVLNTAAGDGGATVGGGSNNLADGVFATVGGGILNRADGEFSPTIAGGMGNVASGDSAVTVGGGQDNTASGGFATVGGGAFNGASGIGATVPGGFANVASGDYSFAAGNKAKAVHNGTFAWADAMAGDFSSTGPNQFLIRAFGGVGINRNNPEAALHIGGTPGVDGIRFPDGTLQTTAATNGGSFWKLTGNAGTVAGTNFLGTTDDQPLEFHVRGSRAIRIEPGDPPGIIIGSFSNSVAPTASGATIGGGGEGRSGVANSVSESFGTVSGGEANEVKAEHGTIGGGLLNNVAGASGATVAGGTHNLADGVSATVGGGSANRAVAEFTPTIAGGLGNRASGRHAATVGGGQENTAAGDFSTIAGGAYNEAIGEGATVPGGVSNVASGKNSFAAGGGARALHDGTFVWSDATGGNLSTGSNQFLIRASGGVGIGRSDPMATLDVAGPIRSSGPQTSTILFHDTSESGSPSGDGFRMRYDNEFFGLSNDALVIEKTDANMQEPDGGIAFVNTGNDGVIATAMVIRGNGNIGIGEVLNPKNIMTVRKNSATDPIADAWTVYSSRRWKTNIYPIENSLEKIRRLRGVSFDWKTNGKHDIGFIAEEVGEIVPEVVEYEANGLNAKSVDYARIVAILVEGMKEQQKEIDELKTVLKSLLVTNNQTSNTSIEGLK